MSAATAEVPSRVEQLTADWLSAVLGVGVGVEDARAEQIAQGSGFSSLQYRLHLTGVDAPATVIARQPAHSDARAAMELLGGYRRRLALPVITLNGWDTLPERSRALCLTLTDRAAAAIDGIDALEVFT